MKKNKYILYTLIALFTLVFCLIECTGKGDFFIFFTASGDILKGEDVYQKSYVDGYHYYYSVFFGLILQMLAIFKFELAKFLWLLLNCVLFWHLFYLLSQHKLVRNLELKKQTIFLSLAFVFCFQFFRDNIHTSQITILILWTCVYGLICVFRGHGLKGAFLLALGINIKLMPIVFIPYLIYRGYFKEVFYVVLFLLVLLFFPSLVISNQQNILLLKSYWHIINPSNTNHVLDVDERSFHSLTTLLSTLFVENVPDKFALPLKRNIADVSLETLSKIILGVRLFLVALTLYFLKFSTLFKKQINNNSYLVEVSYLLLLIPLIFPHQQFYAFLFALPAMLLGLWFVFTKKITNYFFIGSLVFSILTFNIKFWLGQFNPYYEHYKLITYGALLLIPQLIYLRRIFNSNAILE